MVICSFNVKNIIQLQLQSATHIVGYYSKSLPVIVSIKYTSKNTSLYEFRLLLSHLSRSTSSFREARAANLILKEEGTISSTDDRIYKKNKTIGTNKMGA